MILYLSMRNSRLILCVFNILKNAETLTNISSSMCQCTDGGEFTETPLHATAFVNISSVSYTHLWQGVKKALVLVFGTMLMVAAVDAATTLLTQYVPDINEQVHDLITVAMIAATIGVAAWRYIKDAYSTFINILNGKPSEVAAAVDTKE